MAHPLDKKKDATHILRINPPHPFSSSSTSSLRRPSTLQLPRLHLSSSKMPTDKHGVTHAGSLGLFDDEVEIAAAADRAARHERECLAEAIRRHGQHVERERRETDKAVERMAKGKNNVSWMQRLFGRGSSGDGEKDGLVDTTTTTTFKVVHRPVKPEKKYVAEDIDPVNSLWLRECGMVRVKSGDVGGCHIVPKSSIAKND